MLNQAGSFANENTISRFQVVSAMRRMPDLLSIDKINDVIEVAPGILEFAFKQAMKQRDERISTAKLLVVIGVAPDFIVNVKHGTASRW